MTPAEIITHAYQTVLDPREPRAAQVLGDLQSQFHLGATAFVPGDPYASAFREGQRVVVLYILGQLAALNAPVALTVAKGDKPHG